MTKFNVIVATHGIFGEELIKSAELILGKTENVYSLSLTQDKSFEDFLQESEELVSNLNGRIIALVDLFGGTPSNVLTALTKKYDINVVTGVNLPIFIEVYMNSLHSGENSISEIIQKCLDIGNKSIVFTNEKIKGEDSYV